MKHHYEGNLTIDDLQKDVLKEVGNIGAGNAANALSQLIGKKITMNVPDVHLAAFHEIMELAGGTENVVASVFLTFSGDVSGTMFFVLPVFEATKFVQELVPEDFSFAEPPFSELAVSAYQEIGNIMAGSYLTALSDFLHLQITPSVPEVAIDMFGAIISFGLIEISRVADYALAIDAEIIVEDSKQVTETIRGHIFLLPAPDSLTRIFSQLGVQDV